MILNIYALKDKELGCFLNPYYTDTTADNSAEHLRRFLSNEELDKISKFRHKSLYWLGTFDDARGVVVAEKESRFLFDCDDVLDVRFSKDE